MRDASTPCNSGSGSPDTALRRIARSRSAACTCLRALCFGGRSALQQHSPLGGTLPRRERRHFAARLCNGTYLGRRGIHIHGARTTMWRGAQQRTTLRAGATRSFEPKSVSNDSDFRASPRESTREGAGALRVRVAHVRAHARAPSTHHRAVALRIRKALEPFSACCARGVHKHYAARTVHHGGDWRGAQVAAAVRHACNNMSLSGEGLSSPNVSMRACASEQMHDMVRARARKK